MLNRWLGILLFCAMVLANTAIIAHDLLPQWLANDAPPTDAQLLGPDEKRLDQVGIFDAAGRRIGRSWTRSHRKAVSGLVTVDTTTVLKDVALPAGAGHVRLRVETEITYRTSQRWVDELDLKMFGLGIPVSMSGEAMPTGEFACRWQLGTQRGAFLLNSQAPAALGDVIRPFDRLPDLYEGRSWRLDLLDPLSRILPDVRNSGLDLEPVIIRVTGREEIEHAGRKVDTWVVRGGGATAWVTPGGRVLRQEVQVPLIGRLILLDEPYSERDLKEGVRSVPSDWY